MCSYDGFTTIIRDKNILALKLTSTNIKVWINQLTRFLVPYPVSSMIVQDVGKKTNNILVHFYTGLDLEMEEIIQDYCLCGTGKFLEHTQILW